MKDEAFRKLIFSGDITKRLDLDAQFGAGRRVEVDIGSGMGRFILARAAAHPDVQFIGIERLKARVEKIAKKAGPEPLRAVTASKWRSSSWIAVPQEPRSLATSLTSAGLADVSGA